MNPFKIFENLHKFKILNLAAQAFRIDFIATISNFHIATIVIKPWIFIPRRKDKSGNNFINWLAFWMSHPPGGSIVESGEKRKLSFMRFQFNFTFFTAGKIKIYRITFSYSHFQTHLFSFNLKSVISLLCAAHGDIQSRRLD